jgi:hypothetical protein
MQAHGFPMLIASSAPETSSSYPSVRAPLSPAGCHREGWQKIAAANLSTSSLTGMQNAPSFCESR